MTYNVGGNIKWNTKSEIKDLYFVVIPQKFQYMSSKVATMAL